MIIQPPKKDQHKIKPRAPDCPKPSSDKAENAGAVALLIIFLPLSVECVCTQVFWDCHTVSFWGRYGPLEVLQSALGPLFLRSWMEVNPGTRSNSWGERSQDLEGREALGQSWGPLAWMHCGGLSLDSCLSGFTTMWSLVALCAPRPSSFQPSLD